MNLDMQKVEKFAGSVVADMAANVSGVMTSIGDKLGLYKAMAGAGFMASEELAGKTGLDERYLREWLNNQVAGGYVVFDAATQKYQLPDEHIPVLADNNSPVFLVPALEVAASMWLDEDNIMDCFRTGEGMAWGAHHHRLFCGSEALFRPGYKAFLSTDWIRAMDGVEERLIAGAKVADIGCGHGASTIALAQHYPNSQFYGFDSHAESIATAVARAEEEGVTANTHFEVKTAKGYDVTGFDLICFMDCLHDMGDPVGAAAHARKALNPGGSVLLVEPAAQDLLENNINPVSRLYYAASTAVCTPCSKSQEVGLALGAQAGQQKLGEVMSEAGFCSTVKVAETGFNIVLQVKA